MGAGASCAAIPLAKELKEKISSFVQTFVGSDIPLNPQMYEGISSSSEWLAFYDDVQWLIKHSAQKSIDEFAKDLYDRSDDAGLNRVKSIVSTYFMIIQSEHRLDPRYSHFLSVYADPDRTARRPKGNIKVVTWNYDSQFEASYALKYHSNLHVAVAQLQAFPFLSPEGQFLEEEIDRERFSVVRLNGIAGMQSTPQGKGRAISFVTLSRPDAIRKALEFHKLFKHGHGNHQPLMVYAWENEDISRKSRLYSKEIFANTNVLVVVGYSFPAFNEDIDREILRSIKNLYKVYVQDVNPDGILEKVKRLIGNDINYELITNNDNFFNPPEAAVDFTPFDADTNELLAAALKNRGELVVFSSAQTGEFVAARGAVNKSYFSDSDPSYAARMLEVLRQLESDGIFENPAGQLFKLTGKGFKVAEFAR